MLEPRYGEAVKNMKGRKLDGLTDPSRDESLDFLDYQRIENIIECEGISSGPEFAADDLC